jgi:hypothetical protein
VVRDVSAAEWVYLYIDDADEIGNSFSDLENPLHGLEACTMPDIFCGGADATPIDVDRDLDEDGSLH